MTPIRFSRPTFRKIARQGFLVSALIAPLSAQVANSSLTLNMKILSINELAVSGNPGNLVVVLNPQAASAPEALDTSTTYGITTNERNKKITAVLDRPMPEMTQLSLQLSPPSGASSQGAVVLSTLVKDVVIGLSQLGENWKPIAYRFAASPGAVSMSGSRIVTLTLCDGE